MTEKILCAKCGFMLYFGEIIKKRLYMRLFPSEKSVLESYNNICPECGSNLTLETVRIEIED